MKYRIKKETKPTLPTYGKYKAVAVHNQTISSEQILKEAAKNYPLSKGAFVAALSRLADVISDHLREGDKVRLQDWGMMKLEIESDKVSSKSAFKASKNIRGVRLHFIPASENGSPELYKGIHFQKVKDFAED